jgi:uncharacterized protein YjbJ (UPF0337 family)
MVSWTYKKGKLKKKFAVLMDHDFNFIEGQKEDLLEKIQLKLGLTREELNKILAEL